jgi:hypothetical protein
MDTVNFFWASDYNLGNIHLLSIHSFYKKGYECILWCYNIPSNIPEYVSIKDASEITPLDTTIYHGYLANTFRFNLLNKFGGIYSDTDNILIKNLPDHPYILAGKWGKTNTNIFKTPKKSPLTSYLMNQPWQTVDSPTTMYELFRKFQLDEWVYDAKDINYFDKGIGDLNLKIIEWDNVDSYIVHLFASMHRACYKTSEIYKTNMSNLKKFIYE